MATPRPATVGGDACETSRLRTAVREPVRHSGLDVFDLDVAVR